MFLVNIAIWRTGTRAPSVCCISWTSIPRSVGRLRLARLCCAVRGTFANEVYTAQNYTAI